MLSPDPLRDYLGRDNIRAFFFFCFLSGGTTGALPRTNHFKGKWVSTYDIYKLSFKTKQKGKVFV